MTAPSPTPPQDTSPPPRPTPPTPPPPRAFTQGVGLVFQVIGGVLFLATFAVCCGSSLLSKDWATSRTSLTTIGWHFAADPPGQPSYSAQRALTICVFASALFGLGLAATGLGMQAEHTRAATIGAVVSGVGAGFWLVHAVFAATAGQSTWFTILAAALATLFGLLLVFAIGAMIELRRNPPAAGHEVLPADYKIPYSHYHPDPPEVRLAAELAQRRERLAVQQKELEMLEQKLRKKLEEERGQEKQP